MLETSAHPASEVLEEYAEGDLKGIFEDIKKTFRVPFVPSAFGILATHPDYLRVAWRQIHTNMQTMYFESRADDLRRFAVEAMAEIGEVRTPVVADGISDILRTLHYVTPKVLLAVSALQAALTGQVPRVVMVGAAEKRQIAAGVPDGMAAPATAGENTEDTRVRAVFDALKAASRGGRVPLEYRALAAWPDYLEGVWSVASKRRTLPEFQRAVRQLRWMADDAVLGLPFRVEVTPHTLRHAGLNEAQLDEVRSTLGALVHDTAESVTNVSGQFTAIEGKRYAAESPFPVQLA